ncbi:hypothetical protein KIN20_015794 [Parelaphostrongylus tenuis]|uniref:Uncharacterized protein n=1 Tax=Parelaphostrongylus tenuis TaxID=148309 RepID=A0AAD5QMH3_PARTN|nr:hypothetical protein KIN20_015794 [Parelaphostrongylus tenuis]
MHKIKRISGDNKTAEWTSRKYFEKFEGGERSLEKEENDSDLKNLMSFDRQPDLFPARKNKQERLTTTKNTTGISITPVSAMEV